LYAATEPLIGGNDSSELILSSLPDEGGQKLVDSLKGSELSELVDDNALSAINSPELSLFFSLEMPTIEFDGIQKAAQLLAAAGLLAVGGVLVAPQFTGSVVTCIAQATSLLAHALVILAEPMVKPAITCAVFALAFRLIAGVVWGNGVEWSCYDAFNAYKSVLIAAQQFDVQEMQEIKTSAEAVAFVQKYYVVSGSQLDDAIRSMQANIRAIRDMQNAVAKFLQAIRRDALDDAQGEAFCKAAQELQGAANDLENKLPFAKIVALVMESDMYKAEMRRAEVGAENKKAAAMERSAFYHAMDFWFGHRRCR
jgi:hypothetical protein